MSSMEWRQSSSRILDDELDQYGRVIQGFANTYYDRPTNEDSEIAPWLDAPPTPPPKSPLEQLSPPQPQTSNGFFKGSFASLKSSARRNNGSASASTRASESQATLYAPDSKRRSADDGESSRTIFYSGSSTHSGAHSGEVRKQKSSLNLNLLSKLKKSQSKTHLRAESDDAEHPSLRSPVPPLPDSRSLLTNGTNASTPTLAAAKPKRERRLKKPSHKGPPSPPPKDGATQEYTGDLNLDSMDGIVDLSRVSAGPTPTTSSPSSAVDSQSQSDHSLYHHPNYLAHPEFSNPFSTTSPQDKRKAIIPRLSPTSILPPQPPSSARGNEPLTGPGSPTWSPPESWAVKRAIEDQNGITEMSDEQDSVSDGCSIVNAPFPNTNGRRKTEDKLRKKSHRTPGGSSFSSTSSPRGSRGTLRGLSGGPPQVFSYRMRIYRTNQTYHVIAIDLDTTVASLVAKLNRKFKDDREHHNLYLKEQGRERILGSNERPAAIVKLRMEQAGYDLEDGMHLLGAENLGILVRFYYKSQLLAGEAQPEINNLTSIDLSGKGLRTIPPILYQSAHEILTLRLSRNPMIEIPLDFIQSCCNLRDLQLTHMSMKKLPQSLRHSSTLRRLDISCNSIRDLGDAFLDHMHALLTIFASNNRLESLPWHFGRLRYLTTLNISNNKFRNFPPILLQLENLHDLDISFNMITELPEDIGRMRPLEKLVIVGNQIAKFPDTLSELVNLGYLDCRRNQISNLSLVCGLPKLRHLSADHNMVHGLDLSLGPHLAKLIASHNDITQISLVPGPLGRLPFALTVLDLSYAKLSSLDDLALSQLSALRELRLDHNGIRSIPDSLGDLKWLETLSCTDNKLDTLPTTIGRLQKLEVLDVHSNNLNELPRTLWNCASLIKINVTSNFLASWHDPPVTVPEIATIDVHGNLALPSIQQQRKPSLASINSTRTIPPLVHSLEKLYLGENLLTDNVILPLMIFKELRILNLSYNEIQDLPSHFFKNMARLEEIYLSGNKLTSIPVEDFPRMNSLTSLYLNGNKLHTLPQELGKVANLRILDVGSNVLKYNINNYEFDWNWNFNPTLKFLNLSGNKRLQIKSEPTSSVRASRHIQPSTQHGSSGFTKLEQLKVLGLMDVTITMTGQGLSVDIPDENADRRVRTSQSIVCGMGYGIADSLGSKDQHQYMLDLVHEFSGREAIFAMFGGTRQPQGLKHGSSPNRISKYLHDNFVNVFKTQLAAVNERQEREEIPEHLRKDGFLKAIHWTYLKLNQDLHELLLNGSRKNSSQASLTPPNISDTQYSRTGVSGVSLYFLNKTLYAANVGDALVVVSRQGVCHKISRKHDPYDPHETVRIRAAEGSISPSGLVNEEVEVSRSFGYYHLFPPIIARPDIFEYELTDMDEFVIIANRGLWDYISYQAAVDIARTVVRSERPDPMLAAQKLRDFAMSYGANGSTMIMVIWVADLFQNLSRSRQDTLDHTIVDPKDYRSRKKDDPRDRALIRLENEIPAPIGHVTLVFTDIRNSTHLWEANPGMPSAMRLHNDLLRRQLRFCGGYEVKTEGDSFMCSFPTTLAAVWWCLSVQVLLLQEPWPLEILECEDGKPIYDSENRLLARGLSVRMGIHSGLPLCEPDLITHRMDYFGVMVSRCARIMSSALGGQIMCSMDIIREINARVLEIEDETEHSRYQTPFAIDNIRQLGVVTVPVGEVKLKGIELAEMLVILYPSGLEGRHDLKEEPMNPTVSASRVQFSVPQMQELGLLCLRLEALSSGRVFRALPARKASIQSTGDPEEHANDQAQFCADPSLLLPPISDNASDEDLMVLLDSLSIRIENAVNGICQFYAVPPTSGSATADASSSSTNLTPASLMAALMEDGGLDEETLRYIASVFHC